MNEARPTSSTAKGYGYRWQQARAGWLRSNPLCVFCQQGGRLTPATVVDHKTPHRLADARASGDAVAIKAAQQLFWDRANWQSLCDNCHSSTKQRLEKSGRVAGCDTAGLPADPRHHWNR
ncbi:HNH endonuclease [Pseudomonas sp. URMO17WK12:I1]|uniref:HNH endonuclease signature motif containing protein n=1 Tax=unclassified Pseudomonas TaxID=196821 RepID=UPI0004870B0F|nr:MULTISPECIES: HNH endonuclease signature motif containing protein [unclassified Pseudomonas]PZW65249.1 HNH endonuclease [Pseudomonas sp. URMO17WK12:I1]